MKFEKLVNSKFEKLETATMSKITGGRTLPVKSIKIGPTGFEYPSNPDECGCELGGMDYFCTD
jgi:hypothetical protein